MTHKEMAARRRRIAFAVRRGVLPSAIAKRENLSYSAVWQACDEFGVQMPRTKYGRQTIVALGLLLGGKSQTEAARAMGVGRAWVGLIVEAARKQGIKV